MSIRLAHDGQQDFVETHEINVTPFIDVILVLLIIFMIAAPLATVDVAVNLPSSTAEQHARPDKPIFLTVKSNLNLSVDDATVSRQDLGAALDRVTQDDHDKRVFLRADRSVSYGDIMDLMNVLRSAGYLKVALVGMESRTTK